MMSDVRCLMSDVLCKSDVWFCCLMYCLVFVVKRLMSDIWCLVYYVWCLILFSDIWCLVFVVWGQTSDVRCLMLDVWCPISSVCCLMSDVWRLVSRVWYNFMMSDIWCLMSDVWCLMPDAWHLRSDIWCLMYYFWLHACNQFVTWSCICFLKSSFTTYNKSFIKV